MALAISILPTGMSELTAGSIAPNQVMLTITSPEPKPIPSSDTQKAPGIPLARRAAILAAAIIMAISAMMLVQTGPRSSRSSTEPTTTI